MSRVCIIDTKEELRVFSWNSVDIDECSEGTDNCEQGCNNVGGSYNCFCAEGCQLNSDGSTCSGN